MDTLRLPHRLRFRLVDDDCVPTETAVLHRVSCPNCATVIQDAFAFCPGCGQKAKVHRLALHDIFHEAVHALTHADKGVLSLLKNLALRPGVVAREYALEGKRRRYFNPFGFLVLMLSALITVNALVHPYKAYAPTVRANISPQLHAVLERQDRIYFFVEKYVNAMTFIAVPLLALAFWLLFRKRGARYAEVLAAQVFFSGFVAAVHAVVLTPFVHYFPSFAVFNFTKIGINIVYFAFAYRQFYRLTGALSFLKAGLASISAFALWVVVSGVVCTLYINFGV